jgi:NCAIR mutase (PurE)-related protein
MDSKLYTIKGRNYSCIEKAEKENKKIKLVEKDIKKSKNVLITQIAASSYLMVEVFESDRKINKAAKIAAENKNNIHYLKINKKQQNI